MFRNTMIKNVIEEKIKEGKSKFIIYPFGENGLNIKNIMYEYFGRTLEFVVDNKYADLNPNIISVQQLKEKYDDSMYILLTAENNLINMQMQKELLEFADIDHIINLKAEEQQKMFEKKGTLLEYINSRSGKYQEQIKKLLYHNQENIVKIYSADEWKRINMICYSFVKDELSKETVSINDITDTEDSVLFFASLFESFWTNIFPLFQQYVNRGKKCVVMFESIQNFWWTKENIERIVYVMKEVKSLGGQCVLYDNCLELSQKFRECFFSSEYSIENPDLLRQFSDTLIAVQTTGIYKHIYKNQVSIERLYNEISSIDYYVGSDYICEWICQDHDEFRLKMLKAGYPKMDTLYGSLNGETDVSQEWTNVKGDKKAIMLTMENPEKFVDIFHKYPNVCFVWRPDPEFVGTKSCNKKIQILQNAIPHLIIDRNRTYMNAFKISDAMIGMAIFCVPVNYIFTKKPLLLLDGELNMYNGWMSMDYTNEAWYRSGYIADTKKKIEAFIDMVLDERDDCMLEQERYKNEMCKNFDGNVCTRIYEYFEKESN